MNENASNSKRKRFDVDLENQHFTVYDIAAQNSSHDNDCNVISNFSESPDNQIKLRNSTDITVERHPKSEVCINVLEFHIDMYLSYSMLFISSV